MQKAWTPPVRWVFVVATFLGVFSALQSYRLMTLEVWKGSPPDILRLLALNLAYWYVPAALSTPIFSFSHRFRLDTPRWPRALAAHTAAALGFSVVHFAILFCARVASSPGV